MEIRVNCPYCTLSGRDADIGGHLYVNKSKGVMFCHRCGHASVYDPMLLAMYPLDYSDKEDCNKWEDIILRPFTGMPSQYSYVNKVKSYILGRLPWSVVEKRAFWSPHMKNRVFFPLFCNGKALTWQARAIDGSEPKYITYGKKSKFVYGLNEAVGDYAVLCEGVISSLSCPNGISIFGKFISDEQICLIISRFRKVFLAIESGAENEWDVIANKLRSVEIIKLTMDQGRDPNDLGYIDMKRIVDNYL